MNHIASPRTDDAGIEAELVAKGLTAPRITPDDIEANIVEEVFFTAGEGQLGATVASMAAQFPDGTVTAKAPEKQGGPLHLLTLCVLVLKNGFTVTGQSACASPENFNEAIGKRLARADAVDKLWPLMGYELRSRLAST